MKLMISISVKFIWLTNTIEAMIIHTIYRLYSYVLGLGVGTLPIPVTTPGGGVVDGMKNPGVGFLPGDGRGHSGISQQDGSLGSGTSLHPAARLWYCGHLATGDFI